MAVEKGRVMDINIVNIVTAICSVIIGYFIGGIPVGLVIGKVFFHKDIRQYGSGNSGGTNAGRVLGKKIGLLVIILDMSKSMLVAYTIWAVTTFTALKECYLFPDSIRIFQDLRPLYYWIGLLWAGVGHCFSPYLNFTGGKAAATFMSMSTMSSWLGFACGFFYLGTLKFKKMVSFAALVGGAPQVLAAWIIFIIQMTTGFQISFFSWTFALGEDAMVWGLWYALAITFIYVLMAVRHKSNIQRIKEGTERKVTWIK